LVDLVSIVWHSKSNLFASMERIFMKDLYLKPEDRRTLQEISERDGYMIDYAVDFEQKDGKRIYFNGYEK
jgi:hypothetical protein